MGGRETGGLHSVAVAVCTRGRPQMLREALRSLAALELEGIDCRFIVVENNDVETVAPIVAELAAAVGAGRVTYRLEARLGIAYARNAALDAALAMGVDALAFIDDDEVAEPRWLAVLVREANRRGLDLVGGPVGLQPVSPDATASEKMVWRGLNARCRDLEASGRRLAAQGRDARVTVTTGNWLAALDFIARTGLRFDETLVLSGGEDTAFFRALRKAGGRTGWTPDAVASESWPRERLTLGYQFRRARDQALARHRAKYRKAGPGRIAASVAIVTFKAFGGALRTLQALFDGGASLVRAARAFGAAAGIVAALRGRRSRHYETVSGS